MTEESSVLVCPPPMGSHYKREPELMKRSGRCLVLDLCLHVVDRVRCLHVGAPAKEGLVGRTLQGPCMGSSMKWGVLVEGSSLWSLVLGMHMFGSLISD